MIECGMDTFKKILFEDEARKKILEGSEILAKAVGTTLGPKGRIVAIERPGRAPHLTKDGVSVAKSINLKDQFQNMGAQMIKEVASQTVEVAGDGTTTATILAHAIYKNGLKLVAAGHNPVILKKGIDMAVSLVCQNLEKNCIQVTNMSDIENVGTVSANGDKAIGQMLAKAMSKVGKDGIINIEEAKSFDTTLEIVEGMRFNRGFVSPFFITNSEKATAELDNAYVLITNKKFEYMKDLLSLLEQILKTNKPILLIGSEFEGEALNSLTVNKMRGTLKVCAIKAPEFGQARHDMLEDIAVLTGGKIVSDSTGIKITDIDINDTSNPILGVVEKANIGKNTTTLVAKKSRKEFIEKRIEEIKNQLNDPTISENEMSVLKRRLSRLSGGIAIIRVGGATEVEMREKKDRFDDALCATLAAVDSGIVPGGGTALIHASKDIKCDKDDPTLVAGFSIVQEACRAPLKQIVRNAGGYPEVILNAVLSNHKDCGWNAATDQFVNLIDDGIIDPVKVPKTALENASSVAGLMLTVEAVVAEAEPDFMKRLTEDLG